MNAIALADTGVEFQDMLDVEQDCVVKWMMKFNGRRVR